MFPRLLAQSNAYRLILCEQGNHMRTNLIFLTYIIWAFASSASAGEIPEKVSIELGNKLIGIAHGWPPERKIEPPDGYDGPDDPFYIYQELGQYVGTAGWYAVNPWTGDVWDIMGNCEHLTNSILQKEQEKIKMKFSKSEMKEYKRLNALKPRRMYDLEPCGSPP